MHSIFKGISALVLSLVALTPIQAQAGQGRRSTVGHQSTNSRGTSSRRKKQQFSPLAQVLSLNFNTPVATVEKRLGELDTTLTSFVNDPEKEAHHFAEELIKTVKFAYDQEKDYFINNVQNYMTVSTKRQRAVLVGLQSVLLLEKAELQNPQQLEPWLPSYRDLLNELKTLVKVTRKAAPKAEEKKAASNGYELKTLPNILNLQDFRGFVRNDLQDTMKRTCGINTYPMGHPEVPAGPLDGLLEGVFVRDGLIAGGYYASAYRFHPVMPTAYDYFVSPLGDNVARVNRFNDVGTGSHADFFVETGSQIAMARNVFGQFVNPGHYPGTQATVSPYWTVSPYPWQRQTRYFFFRCRINPSIPTFLPVPDMRTFLECIHYTWAQPVANYFCAQLPPWQGN